MTQNQIITVLQEAIITILYSAAPMVLSGLVIGVIISIFQTATQIHEQTITMVPKIVTVLLIMLLTLGWMISNISDFTIRVYGYINDWIM